MATNNAGCSTGQIATTCKLLCCCQRLKHSTLHSNNALKHSYDNLLTSTNSCSTICMAERQKGRALAQGSGALPLVVCINLVHKEAHTWCHGRGLQSVGQIWVQWCRQYACTAGSGAGSNCCCCEASIPRQALHGAQAGVPVKVQITTDFVAPAGGV